MKLNELGQGRQKGKGQGMIWDDKNVIRKADFWPIGGSSKAIF